MSLIPPHRFTVKLRTRLLFRRRLNRLPNLFTLGNGLFGFASIVFAAEGDLIPAAYCILFGALFDALDGRLARLLGITSELGGQLDSLCDAISFCLAPAVLMYQWELSNFGIFGFVVSGLFLLAGLLRLARFNITKSDQTISFLGVPTTIAGCFLATLLLFVEPNQMCIYSAVGLLGLMAGLSYLMISSVRFPTFKYLSRRAYVGSTLFGLVVLVTLGFIKTMLTLFLCYFLFTLVMSIRTNTQYFKNMRKIF